MACNRHLFAAAATVLLLTRIQMADSAGSAELPQQQKEALCSLAEELSNYPAFYAEQIKSHLTQEKNLQATELKLRIHAAKAGSERAKLIIPVLDAYNDKCKTSITKVQGDLVPGVAAVDAAAYLSGRITEALDILADLHQDGRSGSGAGCLTASAGQVVQGRSQLKACGKTRKGAGAAKPRPSKELTSKGYPKLTSTAGGTQIIAGTANCAPLALYSTASGLDSNQVTDGMTLVDGFVKLTTSSNQYTLEQLDSLDQDNKLTQAPAFATAYIKNKAYKPAATSSCEPAQLTLQDVQNSPAARLSFRKLYQNKSDKYTPATDDDGIKQAMATAYGAAPRFTENWVNKALKDKVPKAALGENSGGDHDLEQETNIDTLRQILNYYSAVAILRESSKDTGRTSSSSCPTNQAVSKKTPSKEDCKEHTEQGPCEKAGCKFDNTKKEGEKCFSDPETKTTKKDGKDEENYLNLYRQRTKRMRESY
uniref:Variant surface glycoprotein 1102 n=1 Tax=Trypanosoma brucei TaxID=5691 RepID=M4SZB5_9TRYP|nr:variant surface glycoprotein 1102 [Trypanosoma brucei]